MVTPTPYGGQWQGASLRHQGPARLEQSQTFPQLWFVKETTFDWSVRQRWTIQNFFFEVGEVRHVGELGAAILLSARREENPAIWLVEEIAVSFGSGDIYANFGVKIRPYLQLCESANKSIRVIWDLMYIFPLRISSSSIMVTKLNEWRQRLTA